ncbi:hydroxyacid dehydrogenase [Fusarium circinatum]|uniref:Hydroxyacid dehydrogenase n=1 Tax=Fusarium circinatum TaxID=48490 RepID=A0A8H5T360_FUSCI|nr:hydroxyacid dehydrogenase [Fusarium circinatum]
MQRIMQTSKPFILFFSPVRHAMAALEELRKVAEVELVTSTNRQEFFKDVQDSSLSGYDQIDVKACADRGITVTYAPDPVTNATADLALWLLLGSLRQLNPTLGSLRRGDFKKGIDVGRDPEGKILGILGMGRIGRALKARCDPFGIITQYHNRSKLSPEEAAGAKYVSFEELISESDIISIHVPLNTETRHLVGAQEISKMKDGVIIVNTARGAVIDENALAEALESGKIASVDLDVYEHEPMINDRLLKNERALLVPHLGTHTVEILTKMEKCAMENARRAVLGEPLLTPVPEHAGLHSTIS